MNPPIILLVRFNVQAPHEPLIRFANRETAHCDLVVERSKANRVILVLCLTAPCTVGCMQYSHCLGWVSCILRSSGYACIAFKSSLVYFCGGASWVDLSYCSCKCLLAFFVLELVCDVRPATFCGRVTLHHHLICAGVVKTAKGLVVGAKLQVVEF